MNGLRALWIFSLCVLVSIAQADARTFGKGTTVAEEWPPQKPATIPAFAQPVPGQVYRNSLDEPWQFMQYLYDVDTTISGWQNSLNAMPVQLANCFSDRLFLATLHTVFLSTDGGRTWRNLDPFPPPSNLHSDWNVTRSPMYISSLVARPIVRNSVYYDTLLVSAYSANADTANLRVLYYSGGHRLYPYRQLVVPAWLTSLAIPDSSSCVAFGGLDHRLWLNDTLAEGSPQWRELNPNKVFLRSGRQDSIPLYETWVSASTCIGEKIIAVGSHHWISTDGGHYWHIRPAADSLFDSAISFCDSLHGMTGGGSSSPGRHGWVHMTTDGGRTWSGRVLNVLMPVRAVLMVTPQIGFAAGGDYNMGVGKVWSTTDGGQTWNEDLYVTADFRALRAVRVSNAYVDVIAAGVFPDFRAGIWRTQLYLPDSSRALLTVDPDTLNFGLNVPGQHDTLTVTIHNAGSVTDTITSVTGGGGPFAVISPPDTVAVNPGQDVPLHVVFSADTAGSFSRYLEVQNLFTGRVEIFCTATVSLDAVPQHSAIPTQDALAVWPNPGNASFEIRFEVAHESDVTLRVYDVSGRLVETLTETHAAPGEHIHTWAAAAHASGIYFVRLDTGSHAVTRKVLLIK